MVCLWAGEEELAIDLAEYRPFILSLLYAAASNSTSTCVDIV